MTFPLPDPGDAFTPPTGSPGTLQSAAGTFAATAGSLTTDLTTAKNAVATATANWRGPRTQDFKDGILGPQLELAETMAAVKEVGVLVAALGTALTTATTKVATEKADWDALVRQSRAGAVDPVYDAANWLKGTLIIDAANDAKKAFTTTADRISGEIDAQTNRLVPGGSTLSPDAIARKVAQATGVDGINAARPSTADAWQLLRAGAVHAKAVESLTGDGDNTGEKSGGPFSQLPTDVIALAAMRDAMIADGATGLQLRAVVQQYWVAHAAQSAGIDLDQWDPSFDATGNASVIPAVYKYYGELYLKDPNMKWAGLANIVGPIFAAGFDDLSTIHQLTDKLADLPSALKDLLPDDVRTVIEAGGQLTSDQVKFFEDKFLAMQKHIFMDIGSQHEAYATGGITAVQQMHDTGAITDDMWSAWNDVDSGVPSRIDRSATAFANREQNTVIAGQYDEMYDHDGPVGAVFTYLMTTVGGTAVPGSQTPAEFSHLGIDQKVSTGWGPFSAEEHVKIDTPLPAFDIADKNDRWNYINGNILPNYLNMTPDEVRQIINTPVEQRIESQRIINRLPSVASDLLTDWNVDAGTSVSAGPITIGFP